jgi:transposase
MLVTRNEELAQRIEELIVRNEELVARNEELEKRIKDLEREKNKNSSNSHKPPSSDPIGKRRTIRKKKRKTGRKKGGQQGHKGHHRALLPANEVDKIVDLYPDICEVCQKTPPKEPMGKPYRHQVVDLRVNGGRHITEYRCYRVVCTCGHRVSTPRDNVPRFSFGPRLISVICLLTGRFHLSRRDVVMLLHDVYGVSISVGSVSTLEGRMSKALATASDEAMASAEQAKVKHVDETGWIRDSERRSAWVFATLLVSVYRIVDTGSRKNLQKVFPHVRGILVSDRASVFLFWSMKKRQVCWSHLLRTFVGFSQRDGPAARWGMELLGYADLVFTYFRLYQKKHIRKKDFVRYCESVRDAMKPRLEKAKAAGIDEVSGSCANMLDHWDAMWTFIYTKGVEPTNNHAERELRRLVLWRKRCFGSQSERGDRFVERIMTVTQTLRKRMGSMLDFLQHSLEAMLYGQPAPRLLDA